MSNGTTMTAPRFTVGLDLGDRFSQACFLHHRSGKLAGQERLRTTPTDLGRRFAGQPPMRIALEVGTHSPWVNRLLDSLGHEVLVANPREVRLISHSRRKNDRFDASTLARLARLDPALLSPIRHRHEAAQRDLTLLRARAALVRSRTLLVNHLRGAVKSTGARLPSCSTESLPHKASSALPAALQSALGPVLQIVDALTQQIHHHDALLERLSDRYPEAAALRQVQGVGTLTSLAFLLTIEDPRRFPKSRLVGAYLGLAPGTRQSGDRDPQLHITREGDPFLRQLLVQSAHYILGPFGKDCDLRRHGQKIALRGGKAAKKRAAVAVARKLAVVLHHLWRTQQTYRPLSTMEDAA